MNLLWTIFLMCLSAGIVAVSLRLRDPRRSRPDSLG